MRKKKIFIFDFDGTLTPYPITRLRVFEECGFEGGMMNPEFMKMVSERCSLKNIDFYTACFQLLLEILKENKVPTTKENFRIGAKDIEYNPGVFDLLEKITNLGFSNYLISSGAKDFLEGTAVKGFFEEIYATTFRFDKNGEAIETDFLMTDRSKVDVVKKVLVDNGYAEDDCSNLVYVGDGLTDLYAMEYIKNNGGKTIFVYLGETFERLMSVCGGDVVSYYAKADYTDGSELSLIFDVLCKDE